MSGARRLDRLPPTELTWSVGGVSARLGVPTATLRTWDRRYGLGPSGRTAGGHRRYTAEDVERVEQMIWLMERGVPPLEASLAAHRHRDGEARADLVEVQTAADHVRQALAAAAKFDAAALAGVCEGAVARLGIVRGWDLVLGPILVEVGAQWSSGELGVETEHLVTSCMLTALRARHQPPRAVPEQPVSVVLASAEDDQHKLPVVALHAALAEAGVAALELGSRLPAVSLRAIVNSLNPRAVFLWASVDRPRPDPMIEALADAPSTLRIVFGGPGWPPSAGLRPASLEEAVALLLREKI